MLYLIFTEMLHHGTYRLRIRFSAIFLLPIVAVAATTTTVVTVAAAITVNLPCHSHTMRMHCCGWAKDQNGSANCRFRAVRSLVPLPDQ